MGDRRSGSGEPSRSPIAASWAANAVGVWWPGALCGVAHDPFGDGFAGVVGAEEQGLVEECVPHPAVERLGGGVSRIRFPGAMQCQFTCGFLARARTAFDLNPVP